MRMTWGGSEMSPSPAIFARAERIAASVAAYVMRTSGTGAPDLPCGSFAAVSERYCRMLSSEMSASAMRVAMPAAAPGRSGTVRRT